MDLREWLEELASNVNGFFDEEGNLCIDPGDGLGANSYACSELVQLYRSNISPREAADIIRQGGVP